MEIYFVKNLCVCTLRVEISDYCRSTA